MPNDEALYFVRKIIACRQEEQKNIDALKQHGVELPNADTETIIVKNGLKSLGLPIDETGACEYLGVMLI